MTTTPFLRVAALTHRGARRPANEDSVCLNGEILAGDTLEPLLRDVPFGSKALVLIADGMGGHVSGKLASVLSVTFLWEKKDKLHDRIGAAQALEEANRYLYEFMLNNPAISGMGSTVVGVAVDGFECCYFNVGDSRLYHHGRNGLRLITKDDALLSKSTSPKSPRKLSNALTQSLGGGATPRSINPHTGHIHLEASDRLLLCSDGLTDMLADDDLERLLNCGGSLVAVCARLFELAMSAGGRDNISIVVIGY